MKKIFLKLSVVLLATSLMAFSCDKDDDVIPFGNLPTLAQSFVSQYFSNLKTIKTETESNGGYSVDLAGGLEISFDKTGNWTKVDARDGQAIPNTSFIPKAIVDYVEKNYPNNPINSIEKKNNGYEVDLVGVENDLYFNTEGQIITNPIVDVPTVPSTGTIPETSSNFLKQYFAGVKVIKIEKGRYGVEVDLENGVDVDFDQNGNWKKVDARDGQALSNTDFIPQSIRDYIAKNYPNNLINGIEKKTSGYEVELVGVEKDIYFGENAQAIDTPKTDTPSVPTPDTISNFLNQYFPGVRIVKTEKDRSGTEIDLANGVEVDFDLNGNWTKVDARDGQPLSNIDFIPQAIRDYVSKNYPKNAINSIEKKVYGYEVDLVNLSQDLIFDLNGRFVRLDW